MRIARIVSGGQTGADQGGWDAAIYCDLPYGGWVPRGRLTGPPHVPPICVLPETPRAVYPSATPSQSLLDGAPNDLGTSVPSC